MKYPNKALITSHDRQYIRFEKQSVSKNATLFYRLLQHKSRLNFFLTNYQAQTADKAARLADGVGFAAGAVLFPFACTFTSISVCVWG